MTARRLCSFDHRIGGEGCKAAEDWAGPTLLSDSRPGTPPEPWSSLHCGEQGNPTLHGDRWGPARPAAKRQRRPGPHIRPAEVQPTSKGTPNARARDQGAAGGRPSLRPSDATLEPAHGPLHLRRARRDPHHRPHADRKAAREARHFTAQIAAQGGSSSSWARRSRPATPWRSGPAVRHALRQPALARRPADQLPDDLGQRIDRLHELNTLKAEGKLDLLPTKERMTMESELERLEYNLGGVRDMKRCHRPCSFSTSKRRPSRLPRPSAFASRSSAWSTPTSIPCRHLPDPRQRRRDPLRAAWSCRPSARP